MNGAQDWLLKRQARIENQLAKKHLADGTLVLFDVTFRYYTGRQSETIRMGYIRDWKPGKKLGQRIGVLVQRGDGGGGKVAERYLKHVAGKL